MLLTANGPGVRVTNLITIGAKYMVVMDGKGISAADNLNVNTHPDWSIISTLDVSSNGTTNFLSYLWIDPKIWDMDTPQVTCSAPCTIKIPPWTGATSTVNYPLVTVSQGTWTSTITKPPFAITEWLFEPVTVNQAAGNKAKRAAATTNVWPVPAKIPYWPAFVYTGGIDGKPTTTYATAPFPTPPASIGPNAPAPPSGSWPKRDLEINFGPVEGPLIDPCSFDSFYNPTCNLPPWFGYPNGSMGAGGGGGDVENVFDAWKCPGPRTKSSSSTTSTRTTTAISTPSPTYYYNEGDPRLNKVSCYGSGENTEGARMQNAAKSFCGEIAGDLLAPNYFHSRTLSFPYNGGIGSVDITISLKVKSGCSFGKLSYFNKRDSSISSRDDKFDTALCLKYLSVPTDSCNCAGVNGKQGGIVENNCYIWRIDPNVNIG